MWAVPAYDSIGIYAMLPGAFRRYGTGRDRWEVRPRGLSRGRQGVPTQLDSTPSDGQGLVSAGRALHEQDFVLDR